MKPYRNPDFYNWTTPEAQKRLAELIYGTTLKYREIAAIFGVTKNSIVGAAHRSGIMRAKPNTEESTTLSRLTALAIFPGFGRCVFPIGHPGGKDDFRFCGSYVLEDPLKSYCERHHKETHISSPSKYAALEAAE